MTDIAEKAVELYLTSQTGRGHRGTGYQRQLAKLAAQRLKTVGNNNNAVFKKMGSLGHAQHHVGDHSRDLIQISPSLSHNVMGTSLMMAHEAVHLVLHSNRFNKRNINVHTIDQELNARRVSINYFLELVEKGLAHGSATDRELQLTDQLMFERRRQLVDFVLANSTYSKSINAAWVVQSRTYWGGLHNRWPRTLGLYADALTSVSGHGHHVLDILKALDSARNSGRFSLPAGAAGFLLSSDPLTAFGAAPAISAFASGNGQSRWGRIRKTVTPLVNSRNQYEIESLFERLGQKLVELTAPVEL